MFGSGRDYEFKYEAVLSDDQKTGKRYSSIDTKILIGLAVNEADRNWYEAEKLSRKKKEDTWIDDKMKDEL